MCLQSKTQGRLRCQKRRSLPQPVKKPQNHFREYRQKVTVTTLFQTAFHRIFQLLPQTPQRSFQGAAAGTHATPSPNRAHIGSHGETGAVSDGVLLLPSERSARSQTSPGRVSERQVLPLLGLGRGCSQRTQKAFGTAMRLCASLFRRRRGPAGLRDLFATW